VALLVCAIRRTDERAREDRPEAKRFALLAEPAELVAVLGVLVASFLVLVGSAGAVRTVRWHTGARPCGDQVRTGPDPDCSERLSLTVQGDIRYTLKRPYRDGTTHVIFEPLTFISRLAALDPKPRVNLSRYRGVLAPNSSLRAQVTPAERGLPAGIGTAVLAPITRKTPNRR